MVDDMTRRLGGLLAALLMGLLVSGCGSSDSGETTKKSASTAEFCGALKDFQAGSANADPSDMTAYVAALKAAAQRLDAVGTPEAVPADAKAGFDITINRITGLPDTATQDDLATLGDVEPGDQKKLDALDDYIKETCPDL